MGFVVFFCSFTVSAAELCPSRFCYLVSVVWRLLFGFEYCSSRLKWAVVMLVLWLGISDLVGVF